MTQDIHVDLSPANPWTASALELVYRLISAPAGGAEIYSSEFDQALGRETLTGESAEEIIARVAVFVDAAVTVAGVAIDELAVHSQRDRLDVLREVEQLIDEARARAIACRAEHGSSAAERRARRRGRSGIARGRHWRRR